MKKSAQYTLYVTLRMLTSLYAPFAPHIAGEIGQHLFNETMLEAEWPTVSEDMMDKRAEKAWIILKEARSTIRKLKSELRLSLNVEIAALKQEIINLSSVKTEEKENYEKILNRVETVCPLCKRS